MPRPSPLALGATFKFPIEKGRIGILRILGATEDRQDPIAAVMRWSGPPKTSLEAMRRSRTFRAPQPLTHHDWGRTSGRVIGGIVTKRAPRGLRFVGNVPPAPAELGLLEELAASGAGFDWLVLQARLQWRWDHDRAAVLAEDRRAELAQERTYEREQQRAERRREALRRAGPRALLRRRWFTDFTPRTLRDAARAECARLVSELVAQARVPRKDAAALARSVRRFNALDRRFGLDTIDREQIMDALEQIGDACGVPAGTFDRVVEAAREF